MSEPLRPVFVLSLPRSGSTLLQRFLSGSEGVSTCAEPWFLLPLVLMDDPVQISSTYHQRIAVRAMSELKSRFSGGSQTWDAGIRQLALAWYSDLSDPNTQVFIDKTPRYFLIWERLLQIFPDATVVALGRDPRAVMQSMMDTWGSGKWNLFRFGIDLEQGFEELGAMWASDHPRVVTIRYEDFVSSPATTGQDLLDRLGLRGDVEKMIQQSGRTRIRGSVGDQTGVRKYEEIDTGSIDTWVEGFRSPARRLWLRRWERRHAGTLSTLGYPVSASLERRLSLRGSASDVGRMLAGSLFTSLPPKARYSLYDTLRARIGHPDDGQAVGE